MATVIKQSAGPIVAAEQLAQQARDFSFMQIMRLLTRFFAEQESLIKFKINPNLYFPKTEIEALEIAAANTPQKKFTLLVNFMGLIGADGIMPAHFTEVVLERLQEKDTTLLDFLNIFQHHLLQLYYQISSSTQFYFAYEQGKKDQTTDTLQAISGQTVMQDDAVLYYAGLLGRSSRSAEGLQRLLSGYFDLPITISQYSAEWLTLPQQEQTLLGKQGQQNLLGCNTLLGKKIWQVQNQFTISIGPVSLNDFQQFLPEGQLLTRLIQLVNIYVGLEYDYIIQLLLQPQQIPICILSTKTKPKLGWTTWLNTRGSVAIKSQINLSKRMADQYA